MTDAASLSEPGRRARAATAAALGVPVAALEVRLLVARTGRVVFVVDAPGRRVVAKCYPDRDRAQQGGDSLSALGGEHGPLLVPACLRIDLDARVVVMSFLAGTPIGSGLDGPEASGAAGRVGAAVAALHAIPAILPMELGRAEAIRRVGSLAFVGEDAARAEMALERAIVMLKSSEGSDLVPCHGDLGPAQILDCGEQIGIVDFDKAVMAEPALDLGNLLAQLVTKRGPAGSRMFDTLLDAYRSGNAGGTESEPAPRDGATPARTEVLAYTLLVLLRKLAWLPADSRPQARAAIEALGGWG